MIIYYHGKDQEVAARLTGHATARSFHTSDHELSFHRSDHELSDNMTTTMINNDCSDEDDQSSDGGCYVGDACGYDDYCEVFIISMMTATMTCSLIRSIMTTGMLVKKFTGVLFP